MKKTVWTLNVDHYAPAITAITYPLIERYAQKIGAQFEIITERRWPMMPPVYEKLQIHERGRANDWNIYIDSDTLVHPDFFDPTDHVAPDTVMHNGTDMAGNRWTYDAYFRRDGRHIGSCNWFTVGSNLCLDLWRPIDDLSQAEILSRIHPTVEEQACGLARDHLIDDYTLSRNIARFGLKFITLRQLQHQRGDQGNYLWHQYLIPNDEKVRQMKDVLKGWKV